MIFLPALNQIAIQQVESIDMTHCVSYLFLLALMAILFSEAELF